MTSQQRIAATNAYLTSQGPAWQAQNNQDYQQISRDGTALLAQLQTLSGSGNPQLEQQVKQVLNNSQAGYAISTAAQNNPALITGSGAQATLNLFVTAGPLAGQAAAVAQQVATSYVAKNIIPQMGQLDPKDPATYAAAIAKLKSPETASALKLLGVPSDQTNEVVNKLSAIIKDTAPEPGDINKPAVLDAKYAFLKQELDETADSIKGGDESTPAGKVIVGIGVAAATASFYSAFEAEKGDPSFQNATQALVSGLGLGQQLGDAGRSLGLIPAQSSLGQLVGGESKLLGFSAGDALNVAGSAFNFITAGEQFADHDPVDGSLSIAGGLGAALTTGVAADGLDALGGAIGLGDLALGSFAGPIGIGLSLAAAAGVSIWNQYKLTTQYENPQTTAFLQGPNGGGFNQQAAQALTAQSDGGGYSAVPLLARYAQLQGYNLQNQAQQKQFANWINGISKNPTKLNELVQWSLGMQDYLGGNTSKFAATGAGTGPLPQGKSLDGVPTWVTYAPLSERANAAYLSNFINYEGIPALPPPS